MAQESTTIEAVAREVEPGPATEPARADRVLLRGISWDLYETLREDETNWKVGMAYLDGSLELMSPSWGHKSVGIYIKYFVKAVAKVLRLPFKETASTTLKKPGGLAGKEADASFYLANAPRIRHKKELDLNVDPPPDLAFEAELSRSKVDVLAIYATLGVPEVWSHDGFHFRIHVLQADRSYVEVTQSHVLPFLSAEEIAAWLEKAEEMDDDLEWDEQVHQWARDVLLPRFQQG